MHMFQKFWTKLFEPRRWPESAIWPPSAAWPLQDTVHMREVHDQLQSSLFKHLSSELRNSVYQTALSDLDRFLHICANKLEEFEKQSRQRQRRGGRRVAHWRCTNRESPFPTWQHKCFGEEEISVPGKDSAIVERWVTTSDDMLISLLLSCRRVYSEALIVLYRDNFFHFRGGLSLPEFKNSIPAPQWMAIRHIHISTAYSPFYFGDGDTEDWFIRRAPPKMLPNWNIICELLQELPSLHVLHFEILACDHDADYRFEHYEIYTLCSILKPLRQIKARMIEVEMNVKVPDRVWEILGPVHFTTTFGDRPFNESVFKMKHVHDAIKVPHPCE